MFLLEKHTAEIDAASYILEFRNRDYFMGLCQECKNYGLRWGCPPFDGEPLDAVQGMDRVRIIGLKLTPKNEKTTWREAYKGMKPILVEFNSDLLKLEQSLSGRSFGFAGACPYCDGAPCARIQNRPCLHPDLVRSSLEAVGFDICKTAKDLLGIEIQWSRNDLAPAYFTLIGGVFYRTSC